MLSCFEQPRHVRGNRVFYTLADPSIATTVEGTVVPYVICALRDERGPIPALVNRLAIVLREAS